MIWTNLTADAQAKVLKKQFDEVAKDMDIEVEMVTVSFSDMYTKLATAVQSGEVPDVMHTNFSGASYLQAQNMITPVDDVIDGLGRNDFISTYLSVLGKDGKTWGVPDWALHNSVWYRKDLFAEKGLKIPKTWAEFEATAKALNIDADKDGKTDTYGFAVPMNAVQVAAQTYYEMLYSQGVYTLDPTTGEYSFGKQKEQAVKALDFLAKLYKESSPPSSTEWSWNEYRNGAGRGNCCHDAGHGRCRGSRQDQQQGHGQEPGHLRVPGPGRYEDGIVGKRLHVRGQQPGRRREGAVEEGVPEAPVHAGARG